MNLIHDPGRLPEDALQRLQSYLGQFSSACDADFTTPLIGREWRHDKDAGRAAVANDFERSCSLYSVPEHLLTVEVAKRRKLGSFSRRPAFHVPDDKGVSLEDKVEKYFSPHPITLRSLKSVQYADGFVSALYDPSDRGAMVPLDLEDAVHQFFGRTGMGFPEFVSDREYLYRYYTLSAAIRGNGYQLADAQKYPAVIGTRTQASGPGLMAKARAVFQMSRVIGNLEKCIQAVVFKALRWLPTFSAWGGRHYVDVSVTRFMTRSPGKVLSLDFSNFDATVPFEVIDRVFTILRRWFVPAARPLITFCQESFKRSGIIVPGAYREGAARLGGIPSGSVMTNLIGSLVNLWVIAYSAHRCGGRIVDATVQGDDGLYRFRGIHDVKPLADVLYSELGMVMSTDHMKSLYSDRDVHYLQMVHSRDYVRGGLCVGVRPLMHVLNGALSRESMQVKKGKPGVNPTELSDGWNGLFHTVRWLQQWENASYHPKFDEACKWLYSKDLNLPIVMDAILRNDDAFLAAAEKALSNGSSSYGKVPVRSLLWSRVVAVLSELMGLSKPVAKGGENPSA